MTLRMAQPHCNRDTRTAYLKQRTPEDLKHLAGTKVHLPVAGAMREVTIGEFVQVSLRTKVAEEAKERHAIADAALRTFWAKKRRERDAAVCATGMPETPSMNWGVAVERFGPTAAKVLADEAVADTDANRAAIIAKVAAIYDLAAARLGPELGAGLIGPRSGSTPRSGNSPQAPASAAPPSVTVVDLWKRFSEAKEGTLAPSSIRRYDPALKSLGAFCRTRPIETITDNDIFAWAERRRDEDDILPRVINKNDLAAVKSVFAWATTHQGGKLLDSNPAAGIRLDEPRNRATRERSFREAEWTAILFAAQNVTSNPDNPTLARAKRWCPWLAAYSGARIAELTNLDVEDIWREQGVWVMHFSETKTLMPRTVPLHEHLIEQGFLRLHAQVGSGPLFYDPSRRRKTDAKSSPADLRARDIASWVREVALFDHEVDPNHGWRHTFKSRAVGARIDPRVRDHIVGHAPAGVARRYEHPEITMMAEAISRFPRYEIIQG